jgi:putative ABC transport system ATP-binding protein
VGKEAQTLIEEINFALHRGQVLAILGPSGAGKTTLLRMLNRLDEPTAGTVMLRSQNTLHMNPQELRRHVGMVMQRAYLFKGTVESNIQYGPKQRGSQLTSEQVDALLHQVGLGGYADRDAGTLSGGEAQRVAIARALANDPEILLLDEPTSALDEAAKHAIERLLLEIMRARQLTCVWVTHDRAQARRVADHVLLLEAGTQVAFGTAAEWLAEE